MLCAFDCCDIDLHLTKNVKLRNWVCINRDTVRLQS